MASSDLDLIDVEQGSKLVWLDSGPLALERQAPQLWLRLTRPVPITFPVALPTQPSGST